MQAIVEAHGGAVSASNVEGGGANVTVTLPLTQESDRIDAPSIPAVVDQPH